jgi:erythromycin esterase-like protein/protein-L-isoaspartate O-methyltransferase
MIELARIGPDSVVLEVGAGSGYAAAVIGRIARQVYAIEWHAELAQAASERIAALGYRNVEISQGDGTLGLPEHAPFDAILVAAGGPEVPDSLRRQLSVGGRLVIPVAEDGYQVLTVVRRTGEDSFVREEHGLVMFVPLVGKYGWPGAERRAGRPVRSPAVRSHAGLASRVAEVAEPFADMTELSRLADRYADCKVVLLGEATHGTSEFYQARTWITERLVALHGFTIVAVEADWPDAAVYDSYVRRRTPTPAGELPFTRFPRWMWRNRQVRDLLDRLRAANEDKTDPDRMAGFYGLDIYSLGASIDAVLRYLDRVDTEAAEIARERYACLTPWRSDPQSYGRMALNARFASCEEAVSAMLAELLDRRLGMLAGDGDAVFDAEQNARIVAQAEAYYRAMYYGAAESWNLRDRHMYATLEALLAHRGPEAKAVVWAHNSHIGDATATDMGRVRGEINIGQLVRERHGEAAALIGFGTDRGTVAAASRWDGAMEVKRVRSAIPGSWEAHSRDSRIAAFLLDLGPGQRRAVRTDLSQQLRERAIGVIYRPESELASHYFTAELARQFDAWIWFEETQAVDAASAEPAGGSPETFPFGV